jgi:hypothetical protein
MKKELNIRKAVEYLLDRQFQRDRATRIIPEKDKGLYYSELYDSVGLSDAEVKAYNKSSYVDQIRAELLRAEEMHPDWPVDLIYQCSIMVEEAGEALREANNLVIEDTGGSLVAFRTEVIQTAAMCFRILKNL